MSNLFDEAGPTTGLNGTPIVVTAEILDAQLDRTEAALHAAFRELTSLRDLLHKATPEAIATVKRHPIKERLTHFDQAHKKRFNRPAPIVGSKDSAIMKRLLGTYSEAEIDAFIDQFFEQDDDFTIKAGFTVGVFQSQIGKLIAASSAPRRLSGMTPKTESNRQSAQTAAALIRQQGK